MAHKEARLMCGNSETVYIFTCLLQSCCLALFVVFRVPLAIMPPVELHFITGNANKLAEVQAILGDVVPLKSRSLDILEIQGTMEDISKDKARRAAAAVCPFFPLVLPLISVVDDDGWSKDRRTGPGGRYMSVFQRFEGTAGAVHVRGTHLGQLPAPRRPKVPVFLMGDIESGSSKLSVPKA